MDDKQTFQGILEALAVIAKELPIIFPVHPRTLNRIHEFGFKQYIEGLSTRNSGIRCIDPIGYLDFLCLMSNAKLVLTDSGGMQEETTILGIPCCVTIRENTERPVTITEGTNVVVGTHKEAIINQSFIQLNKVNKRNRHIKDPNDLTALNDVNDKLSNSVARLQNHPPLWDGLAAQRIIKVLIENLTLKFESVAEIKAYQI